MYYRFYLNRAIFCLAALLAGGHIIAQTKSYSVASPGRSTTLEIRAGKEQLSYRIRFKNKTVTDWSALEIAIDNQALGTAKITGYDAPARRRESFATPIGEQDSLYHEYQQARIHLKKELCYEATVECRVMDSSVAFRYFVKASGAAPHSLKEFTTFAFPSTPLIYQYNQESVFTPATVDTFSVTTDLPVTLVSGNYFFQVGEAANTTYTKAELAKGTNDRSLVVKFPHDTAVSFTREIETPWRTVSIAGSALALSHCRTLSLKLAAPPANNDLGWIRPGKLIRAQLNTQSGLDCIDFAVKHHFQHILFDAGWYGPEFRTSSDPTQVIPAIDLPKVIAYAKEKNVGVILYVNYVGLKNNLDTLLPLYKKWGVAGLKFGFVDGLTQAGLSWLSQAMEKVQRYGMVLNIHDNYKPTGLSRTYPALLTQEGIRGDENSPDAFHNTTLPFTRFLAGAADFTFCFPNSKYSFAKNIKVSKAQQLALSVVYYSPLQAIFWYGQPNDYINDQEIEFYDQVPTTWNESRYLAGDIGKGIAIARRKGDVWYLGMAAGLSDWQTTLKLSFLQPGITYSATIYEDGDNQSIHRRTVNFTSRDTFPVHLIGKSGQAVIFRPEK